MSTISDVARMARVSKATVSRVMSGSRSVKEESRQAVLQAADALGYKPNAIARSLSNQTTDCIGVICATEHIQHSTGYLQALEKQLQQQRKYLLLRFACDAPSVSLAVEELSTGLCDALLVVGARFELPHLPDEVVLIDCLTASGSPGVACDHQFAALTAVEYLIEHKRCHIALINFAGGDAAQETLLGYRQAAENHLFPFNRQRVIEGETHLQPALERLLASGVTFNALLVTSDSHARLAIAMLREHHIAVPEAVVVFSLDGSMRLPGQMPIPAIEYPLENIAKGAVALLLGQDDGIPRVRGTLVCA